MEEIDIWRAANLLVQQHGIGAEQEALRLGGLAIEKGDIQGVQVWCDVLRAIKALSDTNPSGPAN